MRESSKNLNKEMDTFGISKERREQTDNRKLDLMLRRCKRKKIQPRDFLIKSVNIGETEKIYGPDLTSKIIEKLKNLPDYNLEDEEIFQQAKKDLLEIMTPIINIEFERGDRANEIQELRREVQKNWREAGLFSYEIDDRHFLHLHIPPIEKIPSLRQLKKSLSKIANIVKENESILQVRASSLLLEHPAARRIGFKVDPELDKGHLPNFRMGREEFINKFSIR